MDNGKFKFFGIFVNYGEGSIDEREKISKEWSNFTFFFSCFLSQRY